MASISHVDAVIDTLLGEHADKRARQTRFVQRQSPITGSVFAQTLIYGFVSLPDASYSQLQIVAASRGVSVSSSAWEQRMTPEAVEFLWHLLTDFLHTILTHEPVALDLFTRFAGVYLQDGTTISLPNELAADWKGCGGRTSQSAASSLKLQVRLNLGSGGIEGGWLSDGRAHELSGPASPLHSPLPTNSVWVVDLGYFTQPLMRHLSERAVWWLSPAKARSQVRDARGQWWDLPTLLKARNQTVVDEWVWVGKREQLPARLIAVRVSPQQAAKRQQRAGTSSKSRRTRCCKPKRGRRTGKIAFSRRKHHRPSKARLRLADWTIILTNLPQDLLSAVEAQVLLRSRWQIELLWRLWKEEGLLDTWRSEKRERILCEIYAKLMGLIIQQWQQMLHCWQSPHRSAVKAAAAMRWMAPCWVQAHAGRMSREQVSQSTHEAMSKCQMSRRGKKPNTYQYWHDPNLINS